MSCSHLNNLQPPGPNQPVYREDCTQCFDSIDDPAGLNVCLTCFNGGCAGDRNHARLHYEQTSHPVVLNIRRTRKHIQRDEPPAKLTKLAIAAETEEDKYDTVVQVHCYADQLQDLDRSQGNLPNVIDRVLKAMTFARSEEVKAWEQEPELAKHLAHWGINIAEREKTEKSLMEMQVEQNLKWDFSMITEDGKELEPLFGQGYTGLKNIGNSCYLASSVQCLFSLPEFEARYYQPDRPLPSSNKPAEDLETQLRKLGDGLLSGRYSKPETDVQAVLETPEVPRQRGLAPAMFKHLIGRGHSEFSTMRQQDAFEFLLHLFSKISESSPPPNDPVDSFRFAMEQRLQCKSCNKVRYRVDEQENISVPVPARRKQDYNPEQSDGSKGSEFEPVSLKECLDRFTAPVIVELKCSGCGSNEGFLKTNRFHTFPQNLAINPLRFEVVNWVPTKLDIPVEVSDDTFDMSAYKGTGLQPGEEELPDDDNAAPAFQPNQAAMADLTAMGIPEIRCMKALHATGNSDAEAAMNWLFDHQEDADIDLPFAPQKSAATGPDPEKLAMIESMGIMRPQAIKALRVNDGNVERAINWVFENPTDPGDVGEEEKPVSNGPKQFLGDPDKAEFQLESIVCHKGASVHAGHYVAFIRKAGGTWVLFNDEKVVKAADVDEMKKFAYVYFFRRR
ncbi:Ubiquitin carboxyl-terminal hydrolase 14 [Cyphellophora attinorum]|uniref:Ubiquitin carboxyl-terminal hydrolase n=1 Tax=Cyphellophora attinorum TaxID=1664694 RepID=A0A0N1HP06_9EURO|nr:Ubiquitin carboxyl-terminal hydrolase 14 [Phialophora attinorum]KPI39372.1 Ubiquitin carboxyl-terminal hydrolase 14 [Phialophora attinorum]